MASVMTLAANRPYAREKRKKAQINAFRIVLVMNRGGSTHRSDLSGRCVASEPLALFVGADARRSVRFALEERVVEASTPGISRGNSMRVAFQPWISI